MTSTPAWETTIPIVAGQRQHSKPAPEAATLHDRRLPQAGIIGNGRTCALVDARACIGWLCLPTFAQFPIFASLLDPVRGGRLDIGLRLEGQEYWSSNVGYVEQRYLPGSAILESRWGVAGLVLSIRDAMPWGKPVLLRDIEIAPGDRPMPSILVRLRPTAVTPPSTRFAVDNAGIRIEETRCPATGYLTCQSSEGNLVCSRADMAQLVLEFAPRRNRLSLLLSYNETTGGSPGWSGHGDSSHEGQWRDCSLPACQAEQEAWRANAVRLSLPDKSLEQAFERSLLTLRLLAYEPSGAVLAAATTSFPSRPGGRNNWDYRYCWVRDSCYTAQAFDLAGCHTEAGRLYSFLLERQSADGQWQSPLWPIEASYPASEEEVKGLCGPGGEVPVRIGNGAAQQDQHDSPGNVLTGVYQHCVLSGNSELAARYWPNLAAAADWCCVHWAEPEAGIWEKRDRNRPWVHGQVMCWSAIGAGIRLAELLGERIPRRWETAAAAIATELPTAAWSEERQAYLRICKERSSFDISVLALLFEGMVPAADPHMSRTVDGLYHVLRRGAAFRRDEEDARHPFYLSTFWMIRALQQIGDLERAYAHLRAVVDGASNLDVMAEYFDPLTSRQFGNIPQAYSHEELVRTACGLLWSFAGDRMVLFPAVPDEWLVPGAQISAHDIPFAGRRVGITLTVNDGALRLAVEGIERDQAVIPERYRRTSA